MPVYRASRCDLKTWTRLRAMTARLTRRSSSSLFPLNITPAITSTHPPLWWKGPLGPLTSGRDFLEDLRETICLGVRRGGAHLAAHAEVRPDPAGCHGPDGLLSDRLSARAPLCRARRARRPDGP